MKADLIFFATQQGLLSVEQKEQIEGEKAEGPGHNTCRGLSVPDRFFFSLIYTSRLSSSSGHLHLSTFPISREIYISKRSQLRDIKTSKFSSS